MNKSIPVLIALALVVTVGSAQVAKPQPNDGEKVQTLVYDVRTLLKPVEDYPATTHLGAGNGGQEAVFTLTPTATVDFGAGPATAPSTHPSRMTEIIDLIIETIDPDTWKDNGGPTGAIRELNGLLVVTTTPEIHQRLSELLGQLREQQGKLVRIRATWLLVDQKQQETVKAGTGGREIDSALVSKLPPEAIYASAETACFSGQTVHVRSGRGHAYVSDLNPIVGQQSVGYDPVMSVFDDGAQLQVTPIVQQDGKTAVLDVQSEVAEWGQAPPMRVRPNEAAGTRPLSETVVGQTMGDSMVERPAGLSQELRTTLRVTIGKTVLVGGMTLEAKPTGADGRKMLLLVEVSNETGQ